MNHQKVRDCPKPRPGLARVEKRMFFDELSNDEWARLSALVSDEPAVRLNRRGRPRAEPRIVANAVLWILTTGEPWSKLPGRYPSGPTCRRRFEEWQASGTLVEMVGLLSESGRTFAYIPVPVPPVASKPAPAVEPPKQPRDDMVRGVFWKSPESWQTSGAAQSLTSGWRPLGAMADITRQLAGSLEVETVAGETALADEGSDTVDAGIEATHAREAQPLIEAEAQYGAAAQPDEVRHTPRGDAPDDQHAPVWMNLAAPGGAQFADPRGYMIYVMAEAVPGAVYRAWAEIMRDGRRVERSGLIGPRFDDADAARQYALGWSLEWIDRECGALEEILPDERANVSVVAKRTSAGAVGVVDAVRPAVPVTRAMPDSAAAKSAVNQGNRAGVVQAGGSYPQHVNAHRMQLRRYPVDGADKPVDRFPPVRKFISYIR
jgi:transposase